MDLIEDSFTAYAGARWPVLYRLAVLLVGESDADDLAQQTLFRAYTAWGRVSEAASPDAYVRRIMVNTMIAEKSRGRRGLELLSRTDRREHTESPEQAVVQREDLWGRINLLPARQRAVIVLRYYEDLSEAAIAEVLGCAPGTVKAHASAALKTLRISVESAAELAPGGRDA